MENNKVEKEHLDVNQLIEKGIEQIVIRKGDALILHHARNVEIYGTISAPGKFITERNEDFNKNKNHCIVNREQKAITLEINEQDEVGNYSITGNIKVGSKFTFLGINNSDRSYSPMELSKKLKMMRSIFDSRSEHANVVNALRHIKAKLKQDIESNDDSRGNTSASFEQTLESNVPENFTIELPLLEGEDKVKFKVDVWIEGDSYNNLKCYLESVDAADMIEEAVDKRIDEEIEIIKPFAVVIES